MVKPFKFSRTPEIHFGTGRITILADEIKKRSENALILTGAKSFTTTKYWKELQNQFKDKGIQFSVEVISKEPTPELIDGLASIYRSKDVGVVVAIGGGSVLDGGKAVSAMLTVQEGIKDYLEGVGTGIEHPGTKVPFIAIPTTSGTGSETTKNAVISKVGKDGYKKSLRHDNFVPDVAIVDPILTMSCPPNITGSCGMDAFTQLLESYVSTSASSITDALAFEALAGLVGAVEQAHHGSDVYVKALEARKKMSYASMISGITLANAGLGLVHGLASTIGGYFDIPHGVVCGTLMGAATRTTINRLLNESPQNIALTKYANVGMLFSSEIGKSNEFYCLALCDRIDELLEKMDMPKLGDFGVTEKDLMSIANNSGNKNNPVQHSKNEIVEVLRARL